MIIRHEIPVLSGVLPPAVYTTTPTPERFFLDLSVYSGTLTAYLEINCSVFVFMTGVRLYNFNNNTVVSPTASVQSAGLTTPPPIAVDITSLPAATYGLWVSDNSTMKSVKLIILQDTGTGSLTKSESQIEIGNRELAKVNTVAAALTAPKYWRYNAANWDGVLTFFAEITWSLTGTGTGTVVLQESGADLNTLVWTNKVTIISAGAAATATRVRSIAFTPIDGRMYRLTTVNSNSMGSLSIFNSKIIVQQTSLTEITKLEEQYLIANTTLAAGTLSQNFLSKWASAEWSGVNNTYTHQVEASDNNTSVIELNTVAGIQIGGSVITSPDNIKATLGLTMPTSQNLDVKATTNSGNIYASRIITSVVVAPPSLGYPYSFCVMM